MNYTIKVNGLPVEARYSDENINEIFIPLLRFLTDLQKEKAEKFRQQKAESPRLLVLLAAPPAAGKSTLCSFLHYLSETVSGLKPIDAIGMDGFHRRQDYLLSHMTVRDGRKFPLVKIKGAPCTFDLEALHKKLQVITSGLDCRWPFYDRTLHNPIEDAIPVDRDIVLLEGNYLLLDEDGWRNIKDYADYTIRILAEPMDLRSRLIERKHACGTPMEKAEKFVDFSDLPNAMLCLEHSLPADLTLRLQSDETYKVVE